MTAKSVYTPILLVDQHKEVYSSLKKKAEEIEEELRHLKRWSDSSLSVEKFENMGAFGQKTMAFEEWLQFILVPRLKEIAENKEELPQSSMLAPYAIREFDGDPEADQLLELLYELDELINNLSTFKTDEFNFTRF